MIDPTELVSAFSIYKAANSSSNKKKTPRKIQQKNRRKSNETVLTKKRKLQEKKAKEPEKKERRNQLETKLEKRKKKKKNTKKRIVKKEETSKKSCPIDQLIHPLSGDQFFSTYWEKKPLLLERCQADFNAGWFSCSQFDEILEKNRIQFSESLDITSFRRDVRETHNPVGTAFRPVVWDFYNQGCSVRFRNPQTYSRSVRQKLAQLQEVFQCPMGANVYLTPPNSQGFAPHFDDVEAFVLQLEGSKRWRVYEPFPDEELPLFSSDNYRQEQVTSKLVLETVLKPGDALYFPRGWIHQANTTGEHSLHITVSTFQLNSMSQVLERTLSHSLQTAIKEDAEFRRGLPVDYLNYSGYFHRSRLSWLSLDEKNQRNRLVTTVRSLIIRMSDQFLERAVDTALDEMACKFIGGCLAQPADASATDSLTVHSVGPVWLADQQKPAGQFVLQLDDCISLVGRHCVRICRDAESDADISLYYSCENSFSCLSEAQFLSIDKVFAKAVLFLQRSFPRYVAVSELPLVVRGGSLAQCNRLRLDFATSLFQRAIIKVAARPN